MSNKVVNWVWMQRVGDAEAKLILLKLADQANDDGECWPSRRTIAEACETSVSTVTRSVRYLITWGFISVVERQRDDGARSSNLYRFPKYTADPPGPSDPPPAQSDQGPGSPTDQGPGSAVTRHEPSVEASVEASTSTEDEVEAIRAENARLMAEMRKNLGL